MSVMQLVRTEGDHGSVYLVPLPIQVESAVEFGTDGLIALGADAAREGLIVSRVDLKSISGAPSSDAEEAAEHAMAAAMRDGDRDAVLALLADDGQGYFIQMIALADRESGQRATVSRYGAVIIPPTGLSDRLRDALIRLASNMDDAT